MTGSTSISRTQVLLPDFSPSVLLRDSGIAWPCLNPAHARQAEAEESALQWLRSIGVPEKTVKKHARARFDIVAGLGFRYFDAQHYFLGAQLFHLVWTIDDKLEDLSPEDVFKEVAALKEVLHGSTGASTESLLVKLLRRSVVLEIPLLTANDSSWWNSVLSVLKPTESVARWWIISMEDYWDALYLEALERQSSKIFSYERYIELRRHTVGLDVTINFSLLGEKFDTTILQKPYLREMFTISLDLLSLENDIESYNKEQAAAGGRAEHNAVEAVITESKCSVQEAIDTLTERYTESFLRLMYLYETEVRPNSMCVPAVELTYVMGLLALVEANVDFSKACPRYHKPDEPRTGARLIELWPSVESSPKVIELKHTNLSKEMSKTGFPMPMVHSVC